MKGNIRKSIGKNLLALSFGCAVGFVLLEVGLRLFNPIEIRVKADRIVLPASKEYVLDNNRINRLDKRIVHTKNSIGFRGAEIPPEGLQNVLSIIAVGGSTTECFYLSDGQDWPAVLLEHLKEDFDKVWLNNAGLDGHSTFGHTILLKDHIAKLRPRIVLFLVGANDVARSESGEHTASQIRGHLRFDSVEGFVKSASAYSEVANLVLTIYRYQRARAGGLPHQNIDVSTLQTVDYPDERLPDILDSHRQSFVRSYEQRLTGLIRAAKDAHIEPILVTQPALYREGTDIATGINLAAIRIGDRSGHTMWSVLELYNDVTRRVGSEENVLVIDLANELESNSSYFYDVHHFTIGGAEEMAAVIYKHLRPYLLENYGQFSKVQ